jgi:CBS domain-containing protein
MNNTISLRIFDFLKNYPPFNILEKGQLELLSSKVLVQHFEENQFVFKQNDDPHQNFYVVKEGAIGLYRHLDEDEILVDICDEGDVFGLRPIVQNDHYRMDARANSETIVYAISVELLKEFIASNDKISKYIIASFSTNLKSPHDPNKGELFANEESLQNKETTYSDIQKAKFSTNPLTCSATSTIQEAAKLMASKKVGSIIIEQNNHPIGIITDKDLRIKVATGNTSITQLVSEIMSAPVITVTTEITVAEAQIAMVKNQITHLCITENGSVNSPIVGIMSEHDIVVQHGNNPSVLIKELKRASVTSDLKYIREKASFLLNRYMEQHVPIAFIGHIMAEINDLITQKAIEISLKEMASEPPVPFAFLSLGSQGRKEQLLITDQDNALIYADVSEAEKESTKSYFISLSTKITTKLNEVGYEFCPADMMASNPKWCLSATEWNTQFHKWISTPTEDAIMMCTIFFDFEYVYGDQNLVATLGESVYKSIKSHEVFLNFLGRNALLNPPPLSFFKQFVVEHNGDHKNQFDLKSRALMPLIDGARLLVFSHHIQGKNNTIERLDTLAEIEPENKDVFNGCSDAFRVLSRFRTTQGIQHQDSGRYIDLKNLGKTERLKLKASFKSIKALQDLIRMRFNLSQMM